MFLRIKILQLSFDFHISNLCECHFLFYRWSVLLIWVRGWLKEEAALFNSRNNTMHQLEHLPLQQTNFGVVSTSTTKRISYDVSPMGRAATALHRHDYCASFYGNTARPIPIKSSGSSARYLRQITICSRWRAPSRISEPTIYNHCSKTLSAARLLRISRRLLLCLLWPRQKAPESLPLPHHSHLEPPALLSFRRRCLGTS